MATLLPSINLPRRPGPITGTGPAIIKGINPPRSPGPITRVVSHPGPVGEGQTDFRVSSPSPFGGGGFNPFSFLSNPQGPGGGSGGQSGFDFNNLFNLFQGFGGAVPGFPGQAPQGPFIPGFPGGDRGLGALLTGASLFGRDEPGFVTEARQSLRNLQTPGGFGSQFGETVGALQPQFQPFFDLRDQRAIADLTQRLKAGLPATAPIQGGEISSIVRLLSEQLDPARNEFLGRLGLSGLGVQAGAARTILNSGQPNALSQALGGLGGTLFSRPGFGTGQGTRQPGQTGTPAGIPPGGLGGPTDILRNIIASGLSPTDILNSPNLFNAVAQAGTLAFGGEAVMPTLSAAGNSIEFIDVATGFPQGIMRPDGVIVDNFGSVVSGGEVAPLPGSAGTGGAGFGSGGFQGLLGRPGFGSAGGITAGLGAAAAGAAGGDFFARLALSEDSTERKIADALGGPVQAFNIGGEQFQGASAGLTGGAAAGFVVGGPVGAVIGAITGTITGFFKTRSRLKAQSAANLKADQNSQASQARTVADFFLPAIEQLGGNVDPIMEQVANLINTVDDPGNQQGQLAGLLGDEFLRLSRQQDPTITSLDSIPGFRERFFSFLMQNAFVAPRAGGGRPLDSLEQARFGARAGFDSPTPGVTTLNVNQFGPIKHTFQSVDRASKSDVDAIVAQLRQRGYTGPLPSEFTTPIGPGSFGAGRILIQKANALIGAGN